MAEHFHQRRISRGPRTLDSDKTRPQQAALLSLKMLVGTDAGTNYLM
jgi:hypothetical protein